MSNLSYYQAECFKCGETCRSFGKHFVCGKCGAAFEFSNWQVEHTQLANGPIIKTEPKDNKPK